ncbi:PadR family transcriptional regulator [Halalkalicoccus sp. NIPERK01]|uniref:PadR family transcriptional regulator n=1 Tax=Halalkalicoccus sp. NIPERK01 TaxID=3053469 RepID=UPI00256EE00A|nr:PadR family transcriptional regulator [Halalkalicoccus sp. NIPERK01]MDL5363861.1 PadR family transcriptional regulator [Halalkalicoccus sp. NIPERK01]
MTAFQQNILTVLGEEPMYGLAIKRELESYYGSEVDHGRLYPNLDDLVERGFVAKSELDKRTNQYELTDEGYELLLGDLEWRFSKLVTDDQRASDITALVE